MELIGKCKLIENVYKMYTSNENDCIKYTSH